MTRAESSLFLCHEGTQGFAQAVGCVAKHDRQDSPIPGHLIYAGRKLSFLACRNLNDDAFLEFWYAGLPDKIQSMSPDNNCYCE